MKRVPLFFLVIQRFKFLQFFLKFRLKIILFIINYTAVSTLYTGSESNIFGMACNTSEIPCTISKELKYKTHSHFATKIFCALCKVVYLQTYCALLCSCYYSTKFLKDYYTERGTCIRNRFTGLVTRHLLVSCYTVQ